MKSFVYKMATVALGSFVAAGAASAGDTAYDDTCLAPIAAYKEGLPALPAGELTAEQKLVKLTEDFRAAMNAFRAVQACHQEQFEASGASEEFASLYQGTRETSRVFGLVQSQFETSIEDMSAAALDSVAPAAGGDSGPDLEGEAAVVSTMEILMDSYMALEKSQELRQSLTKISG